jgi:hypothetical protein
MQRSRLLEGRIELVGTPTSKERGFVRQLSALIASSGLLLAALTGCTVAAPSGDCKPVAHPGAASNLIQATGEIGETPAVDFPTPLITDGLEVTVLERGDGRVVQNGDFVLFTWTQLDPRSAEVVSEPGQAAFVASEVADINSAFLCVPTGSRLAITLPLAEGSEETAVLVADVTETYTARATGRIEIPQPGMPSVTTAPNGRPGITVLSEDPPTDVKHSTLITGNGVEVKEGDTLLVQYTAVTWDSPRVLATTWDSAPTAISLSPYDANSQNGVSEGVLSALTGKRVGSQVLVVVPPAGYASGSDIAVDEGSTLVAVYDILAILE